ncbi:MAG: prepilin-type N-terminal cleavage/methylation domain-containing protein [Candidatus Rokubacteria bacterium]|nr:prepilin-type N-terminal cleavage/methylation domain-containing protein [Candidatus Rokubacteria bacterium]
MRHLGHRGYTFLELLVVLAIVGAVALLVLPQAGKGLDALRLKTTTRQLASVFRYARILAISERTVSVVGLDLSRDEYWVGIVAPGWAREEVQTRYALPASVRLAAQPLGEGTSRERGVVRFVFFPRGGAWGGQVWIEGAKGRRYSILVDPLTGLVRISDGAARS